ncbi:class I SAM-dependent methyltransferase [Pleurocapsa sp. FMAR1]|uniref:class I SAM-dependent methyltransferase n=1 Tax=Pleurocapsa sp. FMAR1 TaxID=3040204 RepID=UPI0039B00794
MKEAIVRQQYNQKADIYDRRWNGYLNKTLSFLQSWAQISPAENVLDVACGTGELERLLLQDNPQQRITGIDISEQMLKIAKQKLLAYPQVFWKKASASELPFGDRSYDVVVCASSFHYFDDPIASLKEIKRVLKPGGRVIILDWCKDYWGTQILDLGLKVFDSAYQQCYTQKEFHDLLTTSGFEVSRKTKFRFGIIWGFMIAEAMLPAKKDRK